MSDTSNLTPEKLAKLNLDELGFRERSDALRYRCKLARVSNPKTPIVREDIGRPKGKSAIRAAKRERVKAMKQMEAA